MTDLNKLQKVLNVAGYIVLPTDIQLEIGTEFDAIVVRQKPIYQPFVIISETTRDDAITTYGIVGDIPREAKYYYRLATD